MKKVILLVLLALAVSFTYAVILKSGSSKKETKQKKYFERSNCVYAYQ